MQYQGWHFEKTLLIRSMSGIAAREFIDVRMPVETVASGNLQNDVRVVLKGDWNQLDREIPSQVYDIRTHGTVTTCRVAFHVDLPAHAMQRIGIFYDNPIAAAPNYPAQLEVRETPTGATIKTSRYMVETEVRTGLIKGIVGRIDVPNLDPRLIRCSDVQQEFAAVVFAMNAGDAVHPVRVSAANWTGARIVEDIRGPVFIKLTRRGHLLPGPDLPLEASPVLTVTCKYFADQNYFLVHSRIEFPVEARVFGVFHGVLRAERAKFTHYSFRPVSPDLPNSEIEEMGHILIDPEHTADLPPGIASSGLLPYDLAWQAFISTRKGSECGLAALQLRSSDQSPGRPFPYYRKSAYLEREAGSAAFFRAPIYAKIRNRPENVAVIPAGSVVENLDAWVWDVFDRDWGVRTDQLGKRLNSPPVVEMHPPMLAGPVPLEIDEPLPRGERAAAYLRYGVR
ncbi:MAG TPA: hypothetical protein VL860_13335 [Planctomycetota bacterium]|nr:hypothetical protein [Planctomycetota bacterium]